VSGAEAAGDPRLACVLVGRTSERRALDALLAGARVGGSGVLVLTGEPGIGKTSLLEEATSMTGTMRVLRAAGVPSEQSVPFAGLLQLLRPLLPLLDHIPLPQSRALSSALLLDPGGDVEPSRFAVGAATLSLLCRAAEDQPIAVLVDDAHLLDSPSAEALVFAARRIVADAVAMVFAIRAGEVAGPWWDSLPALRVEGLDLEAARELVARSSGSAVRHDQLVRLHDATAGNPLGLLELGQRVDELDATPQTRPAAVSEQLTRAFIGRADGLGPSARAALVVAAADSVSVATVGAACALLGFPGAALLEAEDAGLLSVDGDRLEFRHPLVRSAVYGAADAATRRAVHRALAAVVPEDQSDRLAWHLSEGALGPDEATARTLEEVGARAWARGAYAIAANTHERAAQLSHAAAPRGRRLASAGEAAWLAGRGERAVDLLDRALGCAPDPVLRAHIAEVRGAVETRSGSLDAALATLMQAAQDVRATAPATAIRLLSDAIHVCFYLADPATAMLASATIEELSGSSVDAQTRFLGSMASGMALILDGAGDRGTAMVRAAAHRLATGGDETTDRFRLPLRLQGTLWLRDAGPDRQEVRRAIDHLRDEAALGSLPYLLFHVARDAATTDRWDDAESAYLEAVRLARETGQSTDLAVSLAGLACVYARQGRVEECRENVEVAAELAERNHVRLGTFWVLFARGDAASGLGDPGAAVVHYEALESLLTSTGFADPDQSCGAELVETYLQLGRRAEAERACGEISDRARAKGQPWALARAHRSAGLCSGEDAGDEHFRTALDLHASTPDRYETARTELAFGARLRRRRRRVEARPLLRSALATFERLGAVPWADRAARELEATGESAHRREASAVSGLTPQERQIAQLLVAGRTTRETAAALFISPKTVEYHLRHVYLKLDVRSRSALAEMIGRPTDG
jgi:DNA-binding CsgD family transcriptional regulator